MSGRALRTIRGSSFELSDLVDQTGDDFLRVFVEESPSPGLAERVREMFPHAVDVIVVQPDGPEDEQRIVDPEKLRDPREQFRRYLEERQIEGKELAKLFDELLEEEYASAST